MTPVVGAPAVDPPTSPTTSRRTPDLANDDATRAARFGALFDAHHDSIWRTLRRLGVRDAHVDDAAQNVFLVAARRLDDIRAGEEKNFLYGVALRVASEMRRRDPARRQLCGEDLLAVLSDEAPGAEQQLIEREACAALDDVLEGLPDELREVFVLVELDGLTIPKVAEVLGVPTGTGASRLRRAREAFTRGRGAFERV